MSTEATRKDFKYEVAFSFMHRDEAVALAINDKIQDRLKTFIYTQHLEDVAGKDGIDTYKKVFFEEARIVVILYREDWGAKGMTAMEMQGIKDRMYDSSTDFIVLINMDPGKPQWMPKSHIRVDWERHGIEGAQAVIEARVEEFGGIVGEESLLDMAARHKRATERAAYLRGYRSSNEGVVDAENEAMKLMEDIIRQKEEVIHNKLGYAFQLTDSRPRAMMLSCENVTLHCIWRHEFMNSLDGSGLQLTIADTGLFSNAFRRDSHQKYAFEEYDFALSASDEKGWTHRGNPHEWISSRRLSEQWMKKFLDRIQAKRDARKY